MSGLAPVYYRRNSHHIQDANLTPMSLLGTAPSISSTLRLSLIMRILDFKGEEAPGKPVRLYR